MQFWWKAFVDFSYRHLKYCLIKISAGYLFGNKPNLFTLSGIKRGISVKREKERFFLIQKEFFVSDKKVMIIMALTGFVTILSSTIADPVDVYFVGEICMKKDDSWSVLAAIGT